MRTRLISVTGAITLFGLIGALGCGDGTGPAGIAVEGQVLRGPIAPVCISEHPCEAGFAARFDVYRLGRLATRFSTTADGTFNLRLGLGDYEIVPDAGAPLMSPRQQRQLVRVEEPGPVRVTLRFDTGIR